MLIIYLKALYIKLTFNNCLLLKLHVYLIFDDYDD